MSTNKIKLHVGYIGKTRDGKRVEIVNDGYSIEYPFCEGVFSYREDGSFGVHRRNEESQDIIGPWEEPKLEEPTTYTTGQWYGWNGGECPVHPDTRLEVIHIGTGVPSDIQKHFANNQDWDNVVAFRVVTPYVPIADATEPKPKLECWVNFDADGSMTGFETMELANKNKFGDRIRCVRMIEADDQ